MSVQKAVDMLLKEINTERCQFHVVSENDLYEILDELKSSEDEGTITFTNSAYTKLMKDFDEMKKRIEALEKNEDDCCSHW